VETFPLASAGFLGILDVRREPIFLRQYTRKKSGKFHRYWALVESLRTEEGPRQRVVAHLGELNHSQQRRWQRTVVFYNRHGDAEQLRLFPNDPGLSLPDEPDIVRVRLSSTGWTNARAFGDVWLGLWLWRLLKLDEIVARHLPAGRHTVRPADVVAIEVINRLCAPSSEFALAEHWYASTGLEDLLGIPDREITKDRLYRTLDGLHRAMKRLGERVRRGRLRQRDHVVEQVGRLKERFPQAAKLAKITIARRGRPQATWRWKTDAIRAALLQDGAYLLKSNYHGWSPEEFWETYIQLTVAEKAFRTLKSELLIRPMWHQYDGRVEAHVMVCVLAYALWKTLDHLAKQAGLVTLIHKPDLARRQATAKPRPMTPEVILREMAKIQVGDIVLDASDGRQLVLRRVARPMPEQARILAALKLTLPERLRPDRLL